MLECSPARIAGIAVLLASVSLVASPADSPRLQARPPATPGAVATAEDSVLSSVLARIRAATSRYRDVSVALEEGYVRDPMNLCVSAPTEGYPPQLGGMGIHYFRPDRLGITASEPRVSGDGLHTDFMNPSVLVYVPRRDGNLELVAVENLVFKEGWRAAGHEGVPSFQGRQYWHLVDNPRTAVDEAHHFEPHYELHIWVHRENPMGPFFPFNPEVSCEHHDGPTTVEEALQEMRAEKVERSSSKG